METVISTDGTKIAYDSYGSGTTLVLVGGAIQHRVFDPQTAHLAKLLAAKFTVIHYDRRGRGDSTDTLPYEVQHEIEDIEAIIDALGSPAHLFGMSSGGALAIQAALKLGGKVQKLAVYEVPYNDDPTAVSAWRTYRQNITGSLAAGHKGDAIGHFMRLVGTPDEAIEGMKQSPAWAVFESIAPTLAYDAAILGDDSTIPTAQAAAINIPTLVMVGSATFPFMLTTADGLTEVIPNAKKVVLEGQTHNVDPNLLAPVLLDFFST
ncbi:MAG: alpha/beta hydrolase [Chloroflexi bacterium]|nr:alpha/beta hydrolase [Chloroflexota bacterium]MCC6896185.1 alpha/beta hydrolase [Anaerolineae bacterium]